VRDGIEGTVFGSQLRWITDAVIAACGGKHITADTGFQSELGKCTGTVSVQLAGELRLFGTRSVTDDGGQANDGIHVLQRRSHLRFIHGIATDKLKTRDAEIGQYASSALEQIV
jgi:hypothetical protein